MTKSKKDIGGENETDGEGELALDIANWDIRDKIYEIRGQKVMLDYDLARYYGYTTKAFNQQVARNIEKFEGEDFMFQLDGAEAYNFLRSQIVTSSWGGTRYLPYAFTEQGIYMLMTVLKGELATKQSRALVMTFKAMKDYIVDNRKTLEYRGNLELAMKVANNSEDIAIMKSEIKSLNENTAKMEKRLDVFVKKSEISPFLRNFKNDMEKNEYLIYEGELAKASETYIDICGSAEKTIEIVDDYVDIKTLRHLQKVKSGIGVVIYTENLGHYLHARDLKDFAKEFPEIKVKLIKSQREFHDRFIIIDRNNKNRRIYHCGASLKDTGKKLAVICEMKDTGIVGGICERVGRMCKNPELKLGR